MAQGISLHIGLNRVDPASYDGWDGALAGCINDARDMQAVAESQGFSTTIMLDDEATAEQVIAAIGQAARQLSAGDTFLLTYSGHGGQVPDANSDESDGQDETWVLYDRMLVDDELYQLWSQFPSGVRLFMLSDSCHSGTVARGEAYRALLRTAAGATQFRASRTAPPKLRMIPPEIARKSYERQSGLYRTVQWLSGRGDRATIDATIILISGCQDNQLSADGDGNGLFTATLKEVWNDGAFNGTYRSFHQQILSRMPSSQSPNYYVTGATNTVFEGEKPFTIAGNGVTPDEQTENRAPAISGPSSWSADAGPPQFSVDPGSNRYYVFEMTSVAAKFDGYEDINDDNFYATWNDASAAARLTATTYAPPEAAWDRLKGQGTLYYRVGSTASQDGWDGWLVSEPGTLTVESADGSGEPSGNGIAPTVEGPEEWSKDGGAPEFTVTVSDAAPFYVFEMASDAGIFDDYDQGTDGTFYATWQDSDAPNRHTESSYTLPDAAWERLRGNSELHYRIGVTAQEDSWDGWDVSTARSVRITDERRPPTSRAPRPGQARSQPPREGPAADDPFAIEGWSTHDPREARDEVVSGP
jgi:hypothetical protein